MIGSVLGFDRFVQARNRFVSAGREGPAVWWLEERAEDAADGSGVSCQKQSNYRKRKQSVLGD